MGEKKISKNVCPYCGSENVTVDVDVRICCHVKDGRLALYDEYLDSSGEELDRAVSEASLDDLGGYCNDCGEYFDFDHADDSGVYFVPCEGSRKMDKKYSEVRDILDEQAREDLSSFYDNLNDSDRNLFWSVLENIGCSEEFRDYYHSEWEPED